MFRIRSMSFCSGSFSNSSVQRTISAFSSAPVSASNDSVCTSGLYRPRFLSAAASSHASIIYMNRPRLSPKLLSLVPNSPLSNISPSSAPKQPDAASVSSPGRLRCSMA